MSHRDDRSSDARRHRFRPDREPSPKRYRRDDHKLERDRPPAETKFDKAHDSDKKHRRGLREPLHLESGLAHNSKVETRTMSKDTDNRTDGAREGTKKSSDPTKVPQSRAYSQHDNRASVGQTGRSLGRRADEEPGWRNFKDHSNDRTEGRKAASHVKDGNHTENRAWRHDGYRQMEAYPKSPTHKRLAFREHKAVIDPRKSDKTATDFAQTQKTQDRVVENGRDREVRRFDFERSERNGRSFVRESRRDRFGGGIGDRYKGRERLNSGARQGYNGPGGARVEKWKHDLYDEANKSPNPKTEEDRISKIEALLAS